jgi:hypothetical protein
MDPVPAHGAWILQAVIRVPQSFSFRVGTRHGIPGTLAGAGQQPGPCDGKTALPAPGEAIDRTAVHAGVVNFLVGLL